MSIPRKLARVKAMTCIYQVSLYKKEKIDYNLEDIYVNNNACDDFVRMLVDGVIEHNQQLVDISNKYLNNWTIDRLGYTDQAILKMGIFEIMYTDTDARIVINEAVELAKQYSDDAVVKMINGVLDKLFHDKDKIVD